ncbi:MAG: indolepyruvate oxidoreductase subunit beta [Thermodesulfobacteriaceae bacterium]|nr:indolepyruvate oxidoreductase subunit beta [Thermodesulfobacteriaceae bacterium]
MGQDIVNIILVGTGGQGIISACRLLAWCAFKSGFDVKESEIHGMAQRGGSVNGQIRFGKKVFSPVIPNGQGDIMLALEQMEALRYLHILKKDGLILLNKKELLPSSLDPVLYPKEIPKRMSEKGYRVVEIDVSEMAKNLGSSKVENVILLGVLSTRLPFPKETWREVIQELMPQKLVELNLKAFEEGRKLGEKIL